ncbi:GIY-YIG nuclease family protein [Granulosicoccus antarcticus]|nr:GIY-YIG nuclease family protein [Granulosicoccus antarcticus]
MEFDKTDELIAFVREVNDHLFNENNQRPVAYASSNIALWNSIALQEENATLLESVSGRANIYAIFIRDINSDEFTICYIGKTTRNLPRSRIRNHLIKKHEKTGAKLSRIIDHVQGGGSVKIAWAEIEPQSLKNCIEEELIRLHPESSWCPSENAKRLKSNPNSGISG